MSYKNPIGLLGGTFDPIHCGHLKIAKELLEDLNFKHVEFIPNKQSPLRSANIASSTDRLAMIRLAIANQPNFVLNDLEIARPAPSYLIDTLKTLHARIPTQPLCFILGNDSFNNLNHWYQWQQITDYTHLVVIYRPGHPLHQEPWMAELLKDRQVHDPKELGEHVAGKIFIKEINPIATSATKIRAKIAHGEKIQDDELPPQVLHYIKLHHLYR